MKDRTDLSGFFHPENVAVIGVSSEERNLGKHIVNNMLTFGYTKEIISVGLAGGVLFGQQIYRSLDEIERDIDLVTILTPARTIPGLLEQCGRKGVKWVVIESGGFSEMGEEGKPLEKACIEMAEKYDIRFIGPNGIGVINMETGLAVPFMPIRKDMSLGPVSILAQSGGVALSYLGFLAEENIGLNKFVSMGNKLNVDENDLLAYLIKDKGTEIILMYLEGFTDGKRFCEIASKSTKPILVHKSNRFDASARIAKSHTAALFADDKLVNHALEQAGCYRVNTFDDAMDYIKSFTLPPLKRNSLSVVSRSGGHAVIAADACAYYGFELPIFPEVFLKKFESRFRAHVIRLQNPLDLGDLFEPEFCVFIVEEMLKRDDVDGVLFGHGYRRGFELEESRKMLKRIEELIEQYQKPVALVVQTEGSEMDYLKKNMKIPVFAVPENAMRALHLSHQWATRKHISTEPETPPGMDFDKIKDILAVAEKEKTVHLSKAMEILIAAGFTLPHFSIASTEDEAVGQFESFSAPVAMKINRPHISHKTDTGAVILNLNSADQVRSAFQKLNAMVDDNIEVLIQKMADDGTEVILGGQQDHTFGPVLLFGLGGIFVEALEDSVWKVAPVDYNTAGKMIQGTKGIKILQGTRGAPPSDIEAIKDLLVRLSFVLAEFPKIKEIDINPVIVSPEGKGAMAVDVRVIID